MGAYIEKRRRMEIGVKEIREFDACRAEGSPCQLDRRAAGVGITQNLC